MNIGIDIDGVLTNIESWQNESAAKYMYEKYNKGIINAKLKRKNIWLYKVLSKKGNWIKLITTSINKI